MNRELLRSTAVAGLVLMALLSPIAAANPLPQDPDEPAGREVPFPVLESIRKGGDVDPHQLLAKVVEQMGGKKLDQLDTISFARSSWHWQGAQVRYYEKFTTQCYLKNRFAGRVDDACINTVGGQSQRAAYVANGDDRFMLVGPLVFSSLTDELNAARVLRNEVFLALAPWIIERSGAALTYVGLATIKTFEPRISAPADSSGLGGHSDYKPAQFVCHKVVATIPEEYHDANGEEIVFWFSEEDGSLLRFRCATFTDYGLYKDTLTTYELDGYVEVDGVQLPKTLYVTTRDNAERIQDVKYGDIKLNPKIGEDRLKRP